MFKNLFSFTRSQGMIIATLIIILVLGVLYFFVYVPYNQTNLEAKQFRALQTTEQKIADKVENSLALVHNLVRNYRINSLGYDTKAIYKYINNYPKKNFVLSIDTNFVGKGNADSLRKVNSLSARNRAVARLKKAGKHNLLKKDTVPTEDTTITFNDKILSIGIDTANVQIKITYTFKQFMVPILPGDVFDQYIILSQSDVIYQSFPSGITQMVADSLKSRKSAFTNAQVKDVSLSGESYKLFSQQLNLKAASPIIIAGLLSKKNYNKQRNDLPEEAVLFLLLIAVASILALPWIKLYQMGSQDRMTAMDGLFSLAIPMLLMSVLFFAFFSYNSSFRDSTPDFERISKKMAAAITRNFNAEVASTYNAITGADSVFNGKKLCRPSEKIFTLNFECLKKKRLGLLIQNPYPSITSGMVDSACCVEVVTQYNLTFGDVLRDVKVNQLYQLDSMGMELKTSRVPAGTPNPPPGDFSNRDYFLRLKNNQSLYLGRSSGKPFYIEPVTSWTTGTFTTVMSIPATVKEHPTAPYTALSFDLQALDKPVLTPGFTYCIINMQGKVLYHSDKTKQLNEDLFKEFSEHNTLSAALDAHSDKLFTTKYSGNQYNVYLNPFPDLPYAIVIMEDKSYDNIRAFNHFVFNFSMLFAFFIVLALELFIVFVVSVKKHYYRKHYFDISWIGPDKRFQQEYKLALWGNLITIMLLICWIGHTPFLECLFMLLTASGLSYLFLNVLYARVYKQTDIDKYRLKQKAVITLGSIIILIDVIAIFQTQVVHLLLFQGQLASFLLIIYSLYKQPTDFNTPIKGNFSKRFSLMTFTRLIITSGLPVFLFYVSIANYEIKLLTRYRHVQFAKTIQNAYLLNETGILEANRYIDHLWIDTAFEVNNKRDATYIKGDSTTKTLFRLLTIGDKDQITGLGELDHTPGDSSRQYSSLFWGNKGITYCRLNDQSYLVIKSNKLVYGLPVFKLDSKWYLAVIYWVLFFAALAGFWAVLHNILKRLFALNLPPETYWENIDDLLLENEKLNSLIFLIGTPGSGKMEKLRTLLGDNSDNYFVADMILMPNDTDIAGTNRDWEKMKQTAVNHKHGFIIVNHFEYDIKNPISNRLKLNFLEDLLQRGASKVIVVSTVHPINFLDSLNNEQAAYNASDDGAAGSKRTPEHDLERWHVLLGHFKIVIKKLISEEVLIDVKDPAWKKILMYETRSGHFLKKMAKPVLDLINEEKKKDKDDPEVDSLSIKLGITAHYFYMYIWQSLTKEEKFLLYDLAEDGLVNPYDDYNLILLICKGLIVPEYGILKIFNHGFRNFILTAIGNTEAMQIQRQIKDNGNWGKLRMPLVILIVAVLVFLFASQQEAYTTLIKYLTVITVGVPTVLKIFSLFNSSESKAA